MSTTRSIGRVLGITTGVALAGGAINAGLGAAAGATGAAILTNAGYDGHPVLGATQMSAAGNAALGGLIFGSIGLAISVLDELLKFGGGRSMAYFGAAAVGVTALNIPTQILGALLGYAFFFAADNVNEQLGSFMADMGVGLGVLTIPLGIVLTCMACIGFCCAYGCSENDAERNDIGLPRNTV